MPLREILFLIFGALLGIGAVILGLRPKRPRAPTASSPGQATLYVMETTTSPDGSHPYADLVRKIRDAKDEKALRLFACACAQHAVTSTAPDDRELVQAIQSGKWLAEGQLKPETARGISKALQVLADRLDVKADRLQEALEKGRTTEKEYHKAFARARAAKLEGRQET